MSTLLVVDDEVQIRRAWTRHARFAFEIVACASYAEAVVGARGCVGLAGMMIDVHLRDGSGLDLLEALRAPFPDVAAAVVSGDLDPRISERAISLGAEFIAKPIRLARFDEFLNRMASADVKIVALQRAVEHATRRWALCPHETVVLGAHFSVTSREDMARSLGVNVNTLKSRIRTVLEKTGFKTMRELQCELIDMARTCGLGSSSP
jgi:DNA-binding NarL/FixJ family response regulator